MADYYDKQGKPIDDVQYVRLKSDVSYWRVAHDKVADSEISTVWLGYISPVYRMFRAELLPLFETMVFSGPLEDERVQYATLEQAQAGHAAMVARVHALRATQTQA